MIVTAEQAAIMAGEAIAQDEAFHAEPDGGGRYRIVEYELCDECGYVPVTRTMQSRFHDPACSLYEG